MANIIVRIIGMLYRSPLTAIIGDEGNGYYGYAYNCYSIALLISSFSIPSATAKLLSQRFATGDFRNAQRLFRCALGYAFVVGGIAATVLFVFASALVRDANAVPVLRIFAPTVFLFGFLGVMRGYFQAHRSMVQTSISQILEQIFNAVISISAALLLKNSVREASETVQAVRGAMGSAIGTGAGVLSALIFMVLIYRFSNPYVQDRLDYDIHEDETLPALLKLIVMNVTPFILSTFIYNMTTILDQTIFTHVMNGAREVAANEVAIAYGVFSGKAVVMTSIPIAVSSAIAAAMIPNISGLYATGNRKGAGRMIGSVIRMTMLFAFPAAAGLAVLARPVIYILFPVQQATLQEAATLLAVLTPTVVLYSLSTLTNAILQSAGRVWVPMFNSLAAILIQAGFLYALLTATPLTNMALVLALNLHALLTCVFNHHFISKRREIRLRFSKVYAVPLVASVLMAACTYPAYRLFAFIMGLILKSEYFVNLWATMFAIAAAVYVYAAILLSTGLVSERELARFPKGAALVRAAKSLRLL